MLYFNAKALKVPFQNNVRKGGIFNTILGENRDVSSISSRTFGRGTKVDFASPGSTLGV